MEQELKSHAKDLEKSHGDGSQGGSGVGSPQAERVMDLLARNMELSKSATSWREQKEMAIGAGRG